ncbi:MAG: CarD family transcriptional regulator [Oscillospiraceae bacterium]|nr:CarD family transcriptional regulator [Oscillospiraceae bacterium]
MNRSFEAGMHIRYGGSGICLIDRIEEIVYPGQHTPRRCYVLRPLRNPGVEISVPQDNETLCERMKPLRTKDELDEMLREAVGAAALPWQDDRKLRAQEFRRILAGGDAQTLLALVHCLLRQSALLAARGKHLSAADDTVRKDAERMLDEEFAFTLGTTPSEAGRYICEHLLPEQE